MTLLPIVIKLALIGFVAWLVTLIPMDRRIRSAIVAVAVLFGIVYLLQALGIPTGLPPVWP